MSKVFVSFATEQEQKDKLKQEAELRGHTASEAMDKILELGLPIYVKEVPRKFEPVATSETIAVS